MIDFDINERVTKFIMVLENVSKNKFFTEKQQKMAEGYLEELKKNRRKEVNYNGTKIIKDMEEVAQEKKIKTYHDFLVRK